MKGKERKGERRSVYLTPLFTLRILQKYVVTLHKMASKGAPIQNVYIFMNNSLVKQKTERST